MRKNEYPGIYVVLEGIEGSGKSDQCKIIKKKLRWLGFKKGRKYNLFSEPSSECAYYDTIRAILSGEIESPALYLQQLMAKNRNSFEVKFLWNSLMKVPVTVVDRSFYSNFAYHMVGGGGFKEIMSLNENRIIPDVTIFLDITPEESVRQINLRKGKVREIFEPNKVDFAKKLYNLYHSILKNPDITGDVRFLNGMRTKEIISQKIYRIIRRVAERKKIHLLPKGGIFARFNDF